MDIFLKIILVAIPSYLVGAIPASFIAGRAVKGIDLREHGSGNLGAANTFRILGTKAALPVLLFDIAKGFVAVRYFAPFGGESVAYAILAAFIVILGHNYSVFVGFSGGKGVGTTTGAFLALVPYATIMCIFIWLVVLLVSRIVSVASLVGAVFLPFAILVSDRLFGTTTHLAVIILAAAVAGLVIFKHRSNIVRLMEGSERRIF